MPPPKKRGSDGCRSRRSSLRHRPLSATLVRVKSPDEVCGRTVSIYDGELRAELTLRADPDGAFDPPGFEGRTVTCCSTWLHAGVRLPKRPPGARIPQEPERHTGRVRAAWRHRRLCPGLCHDRDADRHADGSRSPARGGAIALAGCAQPRELRAREAQPRHDKGIVDHCRAIGRVDRRPADHGCPEPADLVFRDVVDDHDEARAPRGVGPARQASRRMEDALHRMQDQWPRRIVGEFDHALETQQPVATTPMGTACSPAASARITAPKGWAARWCRCPAA